MVAPHDDTGSAPASVSSSAASSSSPSSELPLQAAAPQPLVVPHAAHPVFGASLTQQVAAINIHSRVRVTLDLQGHNYSLWRMFMELVIDLYGLRAHISPTFDNHDGDDDWRIINLTILSWLYGTMTLELVGMIAKPGATAYAMWASIEALFLHNRRARQVYLSAELLDQRQGDLPISAFIAKLKRVSDALRNVGKPVPDEDLVIALLRGLSDRHKMTATLIRRAVPPPDFDSAVNMLRMDEIEAGGLSTAPPPATALVATGKLPAAPAGYGPGAAMPAKGSTSPHTGKPRRKKNTYEQGSSSSSTTTAPSQAPWMGYVHAYPVGLPPPPRGLLGPRPQAHTALAPPPPQYLPGYGAFQAPVSSSPHQPLHVQSPVQQHVQQQQSDVHGVDQAALMGALHNLSLQNSSNGWVADSGATAHLSSDQGLPNQGGASSLQQ
ncbi:hypothetical protein ACQ4PT_069166 [Festuca glaucescens]